MAGTVLAHQQVDCEVLDEEARLVLQALLIKRVQDRMAGAIGGGTSAVGHVALGVFSRVPAKAALVDRPGLGSAEWHAEMLELDDRRNRLATHIFNRVLVAEPVGAPDRVEHVPAPIVLFHIAKCGTDAALRGDGVTAGREHLGDAGGVESGRNHAQCRPKSGAAGAEHNDVKGMIDDVVAVGHLPPPYRPRKSLGQRARWLRPAVSRRRAPAARRPPAGRAYARSRRAPSAARRPHARTSPLRREWSVTPAPASSAIARQSIDPLGRAAASTRRSRVPME